MVLIQGAGLFIVIFLFGDAFILNKKPSGMLHNTYIDNKDSKAGSGIHDQAEAPGEITNIWSEWMLARAADWGVECWTLII